MSPIYNPFTTLLPEKAGSDYYDPTLIGVATISAALLNAEQVAKARKLYGLLSDDDYTLYLKSYYDAGLKRFGKGWKYADIITVLITLAELLKPRTYLEIGVRRGRSACAVGRFAPRCELTLLDRWKKKNYADMENPGPDLVRKELERVGHKGEKHFVVGDSHQVLQKHLDANPDLYFDLVTVDGDHTAEGAAQDLREVLPRVSVGGALVFDDIAHRKHPHLVEVWKSVVESDPRFASYRFSDLGYGIGFAIRQRL